MTNLYLHFFCREKIIVPKTMDFITFLGNASDPPTITWNDTASSTSGRDGRPLKTFQSATVAVDATYFVAVNIKFEVISIINYSILRNRVFFID